MNTRLKQFLAAENITQSQFADNIEVVRASVSHVLSGRNNPSYEFIKAIMAKYPNLSMEWLMFGKGKMYKDQKTDSPLPIQQNTQEMPAEEHEELLFSDLYDDDLPQDPITEHKESPAEPLIPVTLLKSLVDTTQQTVKQRKVCKIIVMFDDGTFQEI